MVALDYNSVVSQTSLDVEQSKKDISFFLGGNRAITTLFKVFSFIMSSQQQKIAKTLNYQLIMSSWLLEDAQKNYETALANKDWNLMISMLNKLIAYNVEIQDKLEQLIHKQGDEDNELAKYNAEITETIANFYGCLRLFKRANVKVPLEERSELAVSAVGRTQNTLRSIHAH